MTLPAVADILAKVYYSLAQRDTLALVAPQYMQCETQCCLASHSRKPRQLPYCIFKQT